MPTPAENVRLGQARAAGRIPPGRPAGHIVRIIEYTFDDPGRPGSGEPHRLLTTLLDETLDPATDFRGWEMIGSSHVSLVRRWFCWFTRAAELAGTGQLDSN